VVGCKHCREKHAKAATEEVLPTEQEAIIRTRLRGNLVAALELHNDQDARCNLVTTTLVESAIELNAQDMTAATLAATPIGEAAHPSLVHAAPDRFRGLKIEIAEFFKTHGAAAVLCTLLATKEERLGRKLNGREVRDRKFPRVILSAVLAALRQDPSPLTTVALEDMAAATDLNVAMELMLLKPQHSVTLIDRQSAAGAERKGGRKKYVVCGGGEGRGGRGRKREKEGESAKEMGGVRAHAREGASERASKSQRQ